MNKQIYRLSKVLITTLDNPFTIAPCRNALMQRNSNAHRELLKIFKQDIGNLAKHLQLSYRHKHKPTSHQIILPSSLTPTTSDLKSTFLSLFAFSRLSSQPAHFRCHSAVEGIYKYILQVLNRATTN